MRCLVLIVLALIVLLLVLLVWLEWRLAQVAHEFLPARIHHLLTHHWVLCVLCWCYVAAEPCR